MIKIYHNNRCQKSRLGVKLLEKMGYNFEIVNYLINPITKETLKILIKALDMQPIDLVRTNEALWKSEFKGKTLSDDEIINAMLSHPKLIERPIVKNGNKLKKQDRQYLIQLTDATAFAGGDLKKGDKMSFVTMTQKEDDYEQYESEVWKPVFEREILRNNFRWWAFTKIVDRNESAYQKPTHFVWNISVKNAKPFIEVDDFQSIKMQSEGMMDSYREMSEPSELTLIDLTN